jgi:hypothetical protein
VSALACAALAAACATTPPPDVAAGQRMLDEAERLESAGHYQEALAIYERIPTVEHQSLGRHPARALVRSAAIRADRLGDTAGAVRELWAVIHTYPDTAPADDAVRTLVRIGPPHLREDFRQAAVDLQTTEIADNLRFEAAALIADQQPATARTEYEQLARDFPRSGLRDDSLWRAAQLARAARDAKGALDDLSEITRRRRQPLLVGSFNSEWLDDAQLETGRIYLEDLHDPKKAIAAFTLLRDDMRDSTLRDDAQFWIARAHFAAGDLPATCAALGELARRFPDSRYLRKDAKVLATSAGCAAGGAG